MLLPVPYNQKNYRIDISGRSHTEHAYTLIDTKYNRIGLCESKQFREKVQFFRLLIRHIPVVPRFSYHIERNSQNMAI